MGQMEKLTPKQARFVEEYLVDLNATQAAIRAGYSESTARAIGHENLTKPDIQEAIAEARGKQQQRTEITANCLRRMGGLSRRSNGMTMWRR